MSSDDDADGELAVVMGEMIDPCMHKLSARVMRDCFTQLRRSSRGGGVHYGDDGRCCDAIARPYGTCSPEWSRTFDVYVSRAREDFYARNVTCYSPWSCAFSNTKKSPCIAPQCSDLFFDRGKLTAQCATYVSAYCDNAGENDKIACSEFNALSASTSCGRQNDAWRACTASYVFNDALDTPARYVPVPERSRPKRASVATTIAARLTREEFAWTYVAGCADDHAPGAATVVPCPRAVTLLTPQGDYYVRADAFSVLPAFVPYYTVFNHLTVVVVALTMIVARLRDARVHGRRILC